MSLQEMVELIREAGFAPAQRTTLYTIIREF
jgi:2-iminoacetate synthase ThiH